MYCQNCGATLPDEAQYCNKCGSKQENRMVGYSPKIQDPAFLKYLKNSNRYAMIFAIIAAVIAVAAFTYYGETSNEMDNPESMFIGFGIGSMFLLIAIFQVVGKKKSKTWDGTVINKTVKKKQRRQNSGENDYYWVTYVEYDISIRDDRGKTHHIMSTDDATLYNYYTIGDRIRHHGGLNTYEKYDKSRDTIIFCNACASLNDIKNDTCFRCGCPLLK
ncbi:MAG: zinc ribbon domain-containing protein [Vallitaleaceae bacterium]|nr:zinc ribbon domain-containing protein [Vallitaleaceae bacterium]